MSWVGSIVVVSRQFSRVTDVGCAAGPVANPQVARAAPRAVTVSRSPTAPEWGEGLSFEEAQRVARIVRPAHRPIVEVLLEAARLTAGLQVLDLACGQGVPALEEAQRVAPGGAVVGLDRSAPSIALAREFAAAERVPNVSFREGDAEALPFPDRTFDRVTSRFGPMFFPRIDRAVAETVRVLRPGGLVAWLVWGPVDEQPYFEATTLVALKWSGLATLPPEAAQPFRFASGGELADAMRRAGIVDVQESRHRVPQPWATTPERLAQGFWDRPAPPFAALLDRVDPKDRPGAIAESAERFRAYASAGEVRLHATVVLTTGTKPA